MKDELVKSGEPNGKVVLGWVPQPIGGMQVLQQGLFDSIFKFCTHDTETRRLFGGYTYASSGYIPASRNTVVEAFLNNTDSEWLLFLDWDVTFDAESVYTLIDAADPIERPIISGVYVTFFGKEVLFVRAGWPKKETLNMSP